MSCRSGMKRNSPNNFQQTRWSAFVVLSTSVLFFHSLFWQGSPKHVEIVLYFGLSSQLWCLFISNTPFLRWKGRTSKFVWLWFFSFFLITPDVWFVLHCCQGTRGCFQSYYNSEDLIPEQTQLTHSLSQLASTVRSFSQAQHPVFI